MIQRIRDWLHEREIRMAVRHLATCEMGARRMAAQHLRNLVARRSPAQVARMERRMGIGGGVS